MRQFHQWMGQCAAAPFRNTYLVRRWGYLSSFVCKVMSLKKYRGLPNTKAPTIKMELNGQAARRMRNRSVPICVRPLSRLALHLNPDVGEIQGPVIPGDDPDSINFASCRTRPGWSGGQRSRSEGGVSALKRVVGELWLVPVGRPRHLGIGEVALGRKPPKNDLSRIICVRIKALQ